MPFKVSLTAAVRGLLDGKQAAAASSFKLRFCFDMNVMVWVSRG